MTLFGLDGEPLKKNPSPSDTSDLPLQVHALVKVEVNTAMDSIRKDLNADAKYRTNKGLILYAIIVVANIVLWFIGSDLVKKWTQEYVNTKLDEPMLRKAADNIMESKVTPYVTQELAFTKKIVDDITSDLAENQKRALEISKQLEAIGVIAGAQAMSVKAFRRLHDYEADTNALGSLARTTRRQIMDVLSEARAGTTYSILIEKTGTNSYSGPKSSEHLRSLLIQSPDNLGIVADQARREGMRAMIPILVQHIFTNDNLRYVDKAINAVESLTTNVFYTANFDGVSNWWASDSSNYVTWSDNDLVATRSAFSQAKYWDALTNVTRIVELDDWADESRSLAILCLLELGNVKKATEYLSEFKIKARKEQRAAQFRLDLETNSVANATSNIAVTVMSDGDGAFAPPKGSHIWRKIDWQLYDTLKLPTDATNAK